MAPTLGTKLKQARLATGKSTRAVAEQLRAVAPISHATLGNYERDASVPEVSVLSALATLYERPISWFLGHGHVLSGVRYRNLKSKVGVRDRHRFEGTVQRWADAYIALEEHLGEPLRAVRSPAPVSDASNAKEAALWLRKELGLDEHEPVPSVIDVLESFGVRVVEVETDLAIDGMAARLGGEIVVALVRHLSNDRARLTAAHELAHVVRGDCVEGSEESREQERWAFTFASNLLLTTKMLRVAFARQSVVDMVKCKERFGISLAALVYRAQEEGELSERDAKHLWIAFAQRGWRKSEPGWVIADRPTRLESLISMATERSRLDYRAVASITGVREEELKRRVELAVGAGDKGERRAEPASSSHRLRLVT